MQSKQYNASSTAHKMGKFKERCNRARPATIPKLLLKASQIAVVIVSVLVLSLTSYVLAMAGSISGQVTDADGQPLSEVTITLYEFRENLGWRFFGRTGANDDGTYSLANIEAGTYRLGFSGSAYPSPYKPEFYDDAADVESATDITLSSEQNITDINVQLAKSSSVNGQVTNDSGEPLDNIEVTLYKLNADPCCSDSWEIAAARNTDFEGKYSFSEVFPGAYRLGFKDRLNEFYQTEFHNDAYSLQSATDIIVGDGEDITIDAQLIQSPTISGIVTDEFGEPVLSTIRLALYSQGADPCCPTEWSVYTYGITGGGGGTYTISGLAPGTYRLAAVDFDDSPTYQSKFYDNASDVESATDISVSIGQNVSGINIQLAKAPTISGRVTDEAGNPATYVEVELYQKHTDPCCDGEWRRMNRADTDDEGNYSLSVVTAGTYRVGFVDYNPDYINGQYLNEFYDNVGTVDEATDIEVSASQSVAGIDVQLTKRPSISGRVTDESGDPISSHKVALYQLGRDTCCPNEWNSVTIEYTDGNGNYWFKGVDAGTYRVGFVSDFEGIYQNEYYDNVTDFDSATNILAQNNQDITGIDAQLDRLPTISGRVTTESGEPLPDIEVLLYTPETDPCCLGEWYAANFARTDDEGNYQLEGIRPGTYRVGFVDSNVFVYQTEYYDNVPDIESAMDILIVEGQYITGIDAQVTKRPTISGRVTNESGTPLLGIEVSLYQQSTDLCCPDAWYSTDYVYTNDDGNYSLSIQSDGNYRIGFADYSSYTYQPEFYNNVLDLESATDIVVSSGQNVEEIDAQLGIPEPLASISGRVTDQAGEPLSGIFVHAYEASDGACCTNDWVSYNSAITDSSGNYSIDDLVDNTYRIGFSDDTTIFDAEYQPEYYDNATNVESATDIVISNSQDANDINAQLEKYSTLSGRVADESNTPLPNMWVTLYAQGTEPCCVNNWYPEKNESTDGDGNYSFDGLAARNYRIGISDPNFFGYQSEFYNNALDLYSATDILVEFDQNITGIDAKLATAGSISGRVTDDLGAPLASVDITLYAPTTSSCCPNGWVQLRSTSTGESGQYTLGSVDAGTYRLGFEYLEYLPEYVERISEYYNNAEALEFATDIVLGVSQNLTNINATLSTDPPPTDRSAGVIYISSTTGGKIGEMGYQDEDILAYDRDNGTWSIYFDGSDVGLGWDGAKDVDAFSLLPDGSLLFSFTGATSVPGVDDLDGSDIIRFVPTSLGFDTAGTFEMYLDGSDVGLTERWENITAIDLLDDGSISISTRGPAKVKNGNGQMVQYQDEDLFIFSAQTLGDTTAGSFDRYYLDGSNIGLSTTSGEDVRGAFIDETSGYIYVTTLGNFAIGKLTGEGKDILTCQVDTPGTDSECADFSIFLDGSESGFTDKKVDALHVDFDAEALEQVNASSQDQAEDEPVDTDEDQYDIEDEESQENLGPSIYLPLLQWSTDVL
ncbi:MAG: carboxypeptidase-like regulatory domain-containing protein [Chloroflexota bacterium]